jgi:hypothetical protein
MPTLTRRRDPEAQDECWHVYYGDVRVGTIAKRIGIPPDEDPWGWSCGFYPGSHPRECTNAAAATFDRARAAFEEAWRVASRCERRFTDAVCAVDRNQKRETIWCQCLLDRRSRDSDGGWRFRRAEEHRLDRAP